MAKVYQVHKRKIWFLGGCGALGALQYTGLNPLANILRTPGVQNIENRYSSGGATKNHTPGAGTPMGNSDDVTPRAEKHQGIGSDDFKERIGGQKPDPSGFDKAWNTANYGQEKGK